MFRPSAVAWHIVWQRSYFNTKFLGSPKLNSWQNSSTRLFIRVLLSTGNDSALSLCFIVSCETMVV